MLLGCKLISGSVPVISFKDRWCGFWVVAQVSITGHEQSNWGPLHLQLFTKNRPGRPALLATDSEWSINDLTIWFINPVFQPRILYMRKIWGSSYPTPTPHLSIVWSNITYEKKPQRSWFTLMYSKKPNLKPRAFYVTRSVSWHRDTSTRHVFFRPHPTSGGLPSISALITRVRILKP